MTEIQNLVSVVIYLYNKSKIFVVVLKKNVVVMHNFCRLSIANAMFSFFISNELNSVGFKIQAFLWCTQFSCHWGATVMIPTVAPRPQSPHDVKALFPGSRLCAFTSVQCVSWGWSHLCFGRMKMKSQGFTQDLLICLIPPRRFLFLLQ